MGIDRLGVFVQVRLGSQRLPGKALLPLGDSTVIEQVMAALRPLPADCYALLTDAASAPTLEAPAGRHGYAVQGQAGPADDVLARYKAAAVRFGVGTVVRATGDSPLVSARLAREITAVHRAADADLSHFLGCPLGTGVEVIASRALVEAARLAEDPAEREHISTYLYRHRNRFRVLEPEVPAELAHLDANVSVDTREDYERLLAIYAELYRGVPIEVLDVVSWLRGHPERVVHKHIRY